MGFFSRFRQHHPLNFLRRDKAHKKKPKHVARKVVAGLIIGGAIGSIVGKKLLEQHGAKTEEEDDE